MSSSHANTHFRFQLHNQPQEQHDLTIDDHSCTQNHNKFLKNREYVQELIYLALKVVLYHVLTTTVEL